MSPLTLRKQYLPRNARRDTKPPPAHPQAAAEAARPQAKPPENSTRDETEAERIAASNWNIRMRRFKKGFEWDTELELSKAFCRPPRHFKDDTPFYPWLPTPTPRVNFHLNYKF